MIQFAPSISLPGFFFSFQNDLFVFSFCFSSQVFSPFGSFGILNCFPVPLFLMHFKFQVKFQNEMNLRMKAESSAALAEEKTSVLEGKLSHLSESIEREKKRLNTDLAQLKRESKLSVARITADVSGGFY